MARTRLIDTDPNKDNESNTLRMKHDPETKRICNALKHRINMSEWMRNQIKYHFGRNGLTIEQKADLMREEMAIAARVRADRERAAQDDYFAEVERIQRKMSTAQVQVIVQPQPNQ